MKKKYAKFLFDVMMEAIDAGGTLGCADSKFGANFKCPYTGSKICSAQDCTQPCYVLKDIISEYYDEFYNEWRKVVE